MNDKTDSPSEDYREVVYYTKDAKDIPTGGKTRIRTTPDGKEIERFGYDPSGQLAYHATVTEHTTETGRERIVHSYHPNGTLFQTRIARFDKRGELLETICQTPSGKILDRQTYEYTKESVWYCRYNEDAQLIETWTKRINLPTR